jgi:hypothetical protein
MAKMTGTGVCSPAALYQKASKHPSPPKTVPTRPVSPGPVVLAQGR